MPGVDGDGSRRLGGQFGDPGPPDTASGALIGHITLGDKADTAHVTAPVSSDLTHVTFGRAIDAAGLPMDYSRLRSVISVFLPPMGFPSQMPIASRFMTSGFGMRAHPLLGEYRMHSGVDLAAPIGTAIRAPSDGVVSSAQWRGGYGLFVALEHGGGVETRYGHMSHLNVAAGQQVRKGETIGFVGSTGLSTGPHLHYEMRINGQAVNPVTRRKP
ncbi:MAG: M23 family metallopeptidase [Novosphingobium sp.]